MKTRTSVAVALAATAVLLGAVGAQAAPPTGASAPMEVETCLSHHPEWSETDRQAMSDAMSTGDVGTMASLMGDSMGSMASMMGGAMGHMGWGR